MEETNYNRTYKDGLFRMLFSKKEELLSLYNAMRGTNYTNVEDLEVNTLENVIYMTMKNDISFIMDGNLSLYEHQSTWNGNMPLRNLLYIANLYASMIAHKNIYGSKVIELPNPHFVVFYNGSKKVAERSYQNLSSAYTHKEEWNLELKVLVLNINEGYNQALMNQCKTLAEYVQYIATVRRYREQMPIEEAIERAIVECIQNNILGEFLRTHRNEVKHMNLFEYDYEEHMAMERADAWEDGHDEGLESGIEQGMERGIKQGVKRSETIFINILNLIAEQKSKEDILKLYPQKEHIIDRLMSNEN